ncbi:hypothetical protein [Streptomyces rochei]
MSRIGRTLQADQNSGNLAYRIRCSERLTAETASARPAPSPA